MTTMDLKDLLAQVKRLDEPIPGPRIQFEQLPSFADRLQTVQPRNIRAVFAVPPRRNRSRRQWLHLIAVGRRFRTDFALIHELAKDLAPTVLATGIVPIIDPLHERNLSAMTNQPQIVAIVERGTLLYENLYA